MSEILDITQAQAQLQTHGWITRKSEAFHHLPPPALETWLGTEPAAVASTQDWQVTVQDGAASVQVQRLSALNAAERATLFADLPAPQGEAAPFAWAHRALCRQGLRIQVAATGADAAPVRLHIHHTAQTAVDAPLLVLDVAPGARCLLLHTHSRSGDLQQITQNLHMHIRVGEGAVLQHLRIADVRTADHLAHTQNVDVEGHAHYHQALCTSGCAYQLQRSDIDLHGPGACVRHAGLLLTGTHNVDHQIYTRHNAPIPTATCKCWPWPAANRAAWPMPSPTLPPARAMPTCISACGGIALDGQPRLILRPHLEILHDQVAAVHGATWGGLAGRCPVLRPAAWSGPPTPPAA